LIELAGGDRPQGHVGMGCAALAQVHLDDLHIPDPVDTPADEIHRIALETSLHGQGFAHGLPDGASTPSGRRQHLIDQGP